MNADQNGNVQFILDLPVEMARKFLHICALQDTTVVAYITRAVQADYSNRHAVWAELQQQWFYVKCKHPDCPETMTTVDIPGFEANDDDFPLNDKNRYSDLSGDYDEDQENELWRTDHEGLI